MLLLLLLRTEVFRTWYKIYSALLLLCKPGGGSRRLGREGVVARAEAFSAGRGGYVCLFVFVSVRM